MRHPSACQKQQRTKADHIRSTIGAADLSLLRFLGNDESLMLRTASRKATTRMRGTEGLEGLEGVCVLFALATSTSAQTSAQLETGRGGDSHMPPHDCRDVDAAAQSRSKVCHGSATVNHVHTTHTHTHTHSCARTYIERKAPSCCLIG